LDEIKSSKPLAIDKPEKLSKRITVKDEANLADDPGEAYLGTWINSVRMPKDEK